MEVSTSIPAENEPKTNPYFEVLASGRFLPENVKIAIEPYPTLPDELQKEVDDEWDRRNQEQVAKGGRVFRDNPQFVLQKNPIIQDESLDMKLYLSSFKGFIASQKKEIGEKMPAASGSIGTNVLLETQDGKLMVIQRDIHAATKPGAMSVIGGYADFDSDLQGNGERWDPFETIKRELNEEAGVHAGELLDLVSLGVIQNKTVNNPTFVFYGKAALTSEEIKEKNILRGLNPDEDIQLRFIPNSQKEIERMILWWAFSPSPSGAGTLALYGKEKFGDEWFENIQNRLTYRENRLYGELKELPEDRVKRFENRATKRLLRQK